MRMEKANGRLEVRESAPKEEENENVWDWMNTITNKLRFILDKTKAVKKRLLLKRNCVQLRNISDSEDTEASVVVYGSYSIGRH